MTAGKKGEALIRGVLTLVDSALYPWGCQMENGLIGACYHIKPLSILSSTSLWLTGKRAVPSMTRGSAAKNHAFQSEFNKPTRHQSLVCYW